MEKNEDWKKGWDCAEIAMFTFLGRETIIDVRKLMSKWIVFCKSDKEKENKKGYYSSSDRTIGQKLGDVQRVAGGMIIWLGILTILNLIIFITTFLK